MSQTVISQRKFKKKILTQTKSSRRSEKSERSQGWFFDEDDNDDVDDFLSIRHYERVSKRQREEEEAYERSYGMLLKCLNNTINNNPKFFS